MIVLLAFLPLQAWAGIGASSASGIALTQSQQSSQQTGNAAHALQATIQVAAERADQADRADHGAPASQDPSYPADSAESSPPGADFAEQLLPAPLPRMVTAAGRSTVPQYVRTALPDPDLPLLPRPPRG